MYYYPFPSYSSHKMPSNLPRFKSPTTTNPSSAGDFISEFERRCRADSYPVEKWPEALAVSYETAEGYWVAENLVGKGFSIEEVKERFLRHFIGDDIRHHYEQDLLRCSRHQDELLLAFCERYMIIMKRARKPPDRVDECTTEFIMQLPRHAINWLNSVKATNGQTAAKPAPITPSNKQQETGNEYGSSKQHCEVRCGITEGTAAFAFFRASLASESSRSSARCFLQQTLSTMRTRS
jgi:hypothetical protein